MIRSEDDIRRALDAEPDRLALARLGAFVDALDDRRPQMESTAGARPPRRG